VLAAIFKVAASKYPINSFLPSTPGRQRFTYYSNPLSYLRLRTKLFSVACVPVEMTLPKPESLSRARTQNENLRQ
jgi:hypothetical protein